MPAAAAAPQTAQAQTPHPVPFPIKLCSIHGEAIGGGKRIIAQSWTWGASSEWVKGLLLLTCIYLDRNCLVETTLATSRRRQQQKPLKIAALDLTTMCLDGSFFYPAQKISGERSSNVECTGRKWPIFVVLVSEFWDSRSLTLQQTSLFFCCYPSLSTAYVPSCAAGSTKKTTEFVRGGGSGGARTRSSLEFQKHSPP